MGVNSSQDPRFRILAAKAAGLFCQRPLHESPIPPPIPQTSENYFHLPALNAATTDGKI